MRSQYHSYNWLVSLLVSEHTARRTMLELDILGLVDKDDDIDMICTDGIVRKGSEIRLKHEFQWFLSEEFISLRQGKEQLCRVTHNSNS